MNDVLEPVCRRFGMDLITGVGFSSVTSVLSMLRRVERPARIFYISDFDPSGEAMPVGVARQAEFWRDQYAPGADIKLAPRALTREQVIHYRLPRVPIKDSDLRKRAFEDRHGTGAVELDALEALHPGELARLVEEAADPYFDRDLESRLEQAGIEANDTAAEEWSEETAEVAAELQAIRAESEEVAKQFGSRAKALKTQFDRAMQPLRDRLAVARHAVMKKADGLEIELPARAEADEATADESQWLFDSQRSYLEQLAAYRERKNGHG